MSFPRAALCLFRVAWAAVAMACTGPAPPTIDPTPAVSPADSAPPASVLFPRHNVDAQDPFWLGMTLGTLELHGSCLFIVGEEEDGPREWLALWPPHFALTQVRPPAVDGDAPQPLTVGDVATFFGGELDANDKGDLLDELLSGEPRPSQCGSNLYWVTTGFKE